MFGNPEHKLHEQMPLSEVNLATKRIIPYFSFGKNPPTIISILGPNRSGTTALSEVFARLGLPSYLQPFKSINRAITNSGDVPKFIIDDGIPLAAHKETIGFFDHEEFLNPIDVLIKAGYPKSKIIFIPMLREPAMTLTSWNSVHGSEVRALYLIKAIQLTISIATYAEENGIRTIPYVHEFIRDNQPLAVINSLFGKAEIKVEESKLREAVDWSTGPKFGQKGSTNVFFDQPPEILVQKVKRSSGYEYEQDQHPSISSLQLDSLKKANVFNMYHEFSRKAENATGLTVRILENERL